MTEADIVNFACLSGDYFYAHMDNILLLPNLFSVSVWCMGILCFFCGSAGLFVDAGVGPVIANYGLENLRLSNP